MMALTPHSVQNWTVFNTKFKSKLVLSFWSVSLLLHQTNPTVLGFPVLASKLRHGDNSGVDQIRDRKVEVWNYSESSLNSKQRAEPHTWNFNPTKEDPWNWESEFGTDDVESTATIVQIIVYIVLAFVLISFVAFVLCICCPICVLARARRRRRGGHVYARQNGLPTNPPVMTGNTQPQGSQLIGIRNEQTSGPYPVQESMTVIPHLHSPSHPIPTGINGSSPGDLSSPPSYIPGDNGFKNTPFTTEPPPPYPGLPNVDLSSAVDFQPVYNPYYAGPNHPLEEQIEPETK